MVFFCRICEVPGMGCWVTLPSILIVFEYANSASVASARHNRFPAKFLESNTAKVSNCTYYKSDTTIVIWLRSFFEIKLQVVD